MKWITLRSLLVLLVLSWLFLLVFSYHISSRNMVKPRLLRQQYVDIAVRAAEQLFKTEQAQEKKAYVVNYLSERGIKFDTATIENMIEASVLLLHNELYGTKQEENK